MTEFTVDAFYQIQAIIKQMFDFNFRFDYSFFVLAILVALENNNESGLSTSISR